MVPSLSVAVGQAMAETTKELLGRVLRDLRSLQREVEVEVRAVPRLGLLVYLLDMAILEGSKQTREDE